MHFYGRPQATLASQRHCSLEHAVEYYLAGSKCKSNLCQKGLLL